MIWIFIYFAIIVLGALRVIFSKTTILLRGKTILIVNFIFTALIFLVVLITRSFPSMILLIFLAIILVLPFFVKNKWILLHNTPAKTAEVIEGCFSMILLSFTKNASGYDLKLAAGNAGMAVYRLLPGIGIMNFNGSWRQKKVEVLQALLVKNFRSMFPKIVIHLKSKNNV